MTTINIKSFTALRKMEDKYELVFCQYWEFELKILNLQGSHSISPFYIGYF
jgi:hypothetical protein